MTISELLDSSAFLVADEDRWPGLLASVTGAYVTVYVWDPYTSTVGSTIDVYDTGRYNGFHAATASGDAQADETVLARIDKVAEILNSILYAEEEE